MEFYEKTGRVAIGSRLRLLTDMITSDMSDVYNMYGVELKPKWFPVFQTLAMEGSKSITEIAKSIGHSHPSVSNIAKEMMREKIVKEVGDKSDGRRTKIALTGKGLKISSILNEQCQDVAAAVDTICSSTTNDLWRAIDEWTEQLSEKSMQQRVKEERCKRLAGLITVVPYEDKYQPAFKQLNEEWITKQWELEEIDKRIINNPRASIIDNGGHILVALFDKEPVGVVALVPAKIEGYDFDIEKYAVSSKMQGRGIGTFLFKAAIEKAKSLGAKKIFLETNSTLKAAIHVYKKVGFVEVKGYATEYARADVLMELTI